MQIRKSPCRVTSRSLNFLYPSTAVFERFSVILVTAREGACALNGLLMRIGSRVTGTICGYVLDNSQLAVTDANIWCIKSDRCANTREIDYSADVPNGSVETIVHIGFRNEGWTQSDKQSCSEEGIGFVTVFDEVWDQKYRHCHGNWHRIISFLFTVLYLRRFLAGVLTQKPCFEARHFLIGFVVDKDALG